MKNLILLIAIVKGELLSASDVELIDGRVQPIIYCEVSETGLLGIHEKKCNFAISKMETFDSTTQRFPNDGTENEYSCIIANGSELEHDLDIYAGLEDVYIYGNCGSRDASNPLDLLDGYGCYCNPANRDIPYGVGRPVDELDKECQRQLRAQKCIEEDSVVNTSARKKRSDNFVCDSTFTGHFTVASIQDLSEEEISEQCLFVNTLIANHYGWSEDHTACAVFNCINDSAMFAVIIESAFNPDSTFSSNEFKRTEVGGNFDYAENCEKIYYNDDRGRCCGQGPDRLPLTINQACCVDNTIERSYRMGREECCSSGTISEVVEVGTCAGTVLDFDR